jgi:spore coat protein U-like protein
MKKYILAVVVALVVVAMAGSAMAAGNQTVAVSATVVGVCQFLTGGTMAFTLDPSVGGNVNGTASQPTFWCTRGTTYTITDNNGIHFGAGSRRMQHASSATDFIPYTFTYTASSAGSGRNTTLTMNLASTVVATDYIDALSGNYADTVTLTINP